MTVNRITTANSTLASVFLKKKNRTPSRKSLAPMPVDETTTFTPTNFSGQIIFRTKTIAHRTATVNILPAAQSKSVEVAATTQCHCSRYSHTLASPTR